MMKLDGGAFVVGLIASREMRCYATVEGYAKVMRLELHYGTTLLLAPAATMVTVVVGSG